MAMVEEQEKGVVTPPRESVKGFSVWFQAIRPRTLSLSLTPVIVGMAFSWVEGGKIAPLAMLAAALGAVLIQIGANLYNDAVDFERGADRPGRLGPSRVTANGLVSAVTVKKCAFACFGLTALLGIYLVLIGGWPILVLGIASIFCGWAYTGGPYPIAYTPFSEAFVILFFGIGAVGGVVWLNLATLPPMAIGIGVMLGLFAAAVSFVNNYRDVAQDSLAGRRTLALYLGDGLGGFLYVLMLGLPFFMVASLIEYFPDRHCWLALGALPLALRAMHFFVNQPRTEFNRLLEQTGRLQAAFGFLLTLGMLWR